MWKWHPKQRSSYFYTSFLLIKRHADVHWQQKIALFSEDFFDGPEVWHKEDAVDLCWRQRAVSMLKNADGALNKRKTDLNWYVSFRQPEMPHNSHTTTPLFHCPSLWAGGGGGVTKFNVLVQRQEVVKSAVFLLKICSSKVRINTLSVSSVNRMTAGWPHHIRPRLKAVNHQHKGRPSQTTRLMFCKRWGQNPTWWAQTHAVSAAQSRYHAHMTAYNLCRVIG